MGTETHALAQQAFDKVWQRFVVEKASQSSKLDADGAEICAYRGLDGARCAIGLLIDDRDYRPEMEGRAAEKLHGLANSPLVLATLPLCDRDGNTLCERLQSAHDDCFDRMRDELTAIAEQFGLQVPR